MSEDQDLRKLYHDLDSKCASLKGAVKLLRECQPEEKKEMIDLMTDCANSLVKCLSDLKQRLG